MRRLDRVLMPECQIVGNACRCTFLAVAPKSCDRVRRSIFDWATSPTVDALDDAAASVQSHVALELLATGCNEGAIVDSFSDNDLGFSATAACAEGSIDSASALQTWRNTIFNSMNPSGSRH